MSVAPAEDISCQVLVEYVVQFVEMVLELELNNVMIRIIFLMMDVQIYVKLKHVRKIVHVMVG